MNTYLQFIFNNKIIIHAIDKSRKLKQKLLMILLLAVSLELVSQTVSYTYYQAGNRISRKVVSLPLPPQQVAKHHVDSTSVQDMMGERTITVYPNPTRGALGVEIKGGDTEDALYITLFSGQGVQLYNSVAQPGINPIDMTVYPKGWYLLRVQVGENKKEFKVIKE